MGVARLGSRIVRMSALYVSRRQPTCAVTGRRDHDARACAISSRPMLAHGHPSCQGAMLPSFIAAPSLLAYTTIRGSSGARGRAFGRLTDAEIKRLRTAADLARSNEGMMARRKGFDVLIASDGCAAAKAAVTTPVRFPWPHGTRARRGRQASTRRLPAIDPRRETESSVTMIRPA
jgi:hypothetical protein